MILVTGGTGFIGKVLIRQLVDAGHTVRVLIRPSPRSPDIPRGLSVDVVVSSLADERGLRSALVGVDTIYHLAGVERKGVYASLMAVDIRGTTALAFAAKEAGIDRFIYLSHLGADRASAYPVLKAKAVAEESIRKCGVDYTIFRTSIVFGEEDGFTTALARILSTFPGVFLMPGDGKVMLQPLWVEDLATCLTWALADTKTRNRMIEIGGPEYLTFQQILECMMEVMGINRKLIPTRQPYLRLLTVVLEALLPGFPFSVYWIDYLATNRTCSLDTITRTFSLLPVRFCQNIDYLIGFNWRSSLLRTIFQRK